MKDYPTKIKTELEEIEKRIHDLGKKIDTDVDDELERLKWVERDFTPNDGESEYYFMVKLAPISNYTNRYHYEVSDGFIRVLGSSENLDDAIAAVRKEVFNQLNENIENGWKHNAD